MSERKVNFLKEMSEGVVIAGCEDAVVIFEPIFNDPPDAASQIESLRLRIRQNPNNLDLYGQLAKLYDEGSDDQFQTYLSGLICASKEGNAYLSRRFYEKAKKIHPEYLVHARIFPRPVTKNRKRYLLVGEGDFSFTEAFKKKHPRRELTATELLGPSSDEVKERVNKLSLDGTNVLFGIDGRKIHETFSGEHFKRIHWNCPFKEVEGSWNEFKKVIPEFFRSCSSLQLAGDRVHVALDQSGDYWKIRQQENPIVQASANAGYRLIRKRAFGRERYPGYVHTKTGKSSEFTGGDEREFVFEKVGTPTSVKDAQKLMDPSQKSYQVKTDSTEPKEEDYYFECSTDEDSSESEAS